MAMKMSVKDVERFAKETEFSTKRNQGGMGPPDMASTYTLLKKLNPSVVIESGVHRGVGTRLIRKALGPKALIYCLDPRDIPHADGSAMTIYLSGDDFVDLADLDLRGFDKEKLLVLLDDHRDQEKRLMTCRKHGVRHMLFNDNYPLGVEGSHKSIDNIAEGSPALAGIEEKTIFPPVYPPGGFATVVPPLLTKGVPDVLKPFYDTRDSYRHNTYIRMAPE